MIYDFIVMNRITEELKEKITGGLIVKAEQPSKLIITIDIREKGKLLSLLLSAEPQRARIHTTKENYKVPSPPHNFSLLLKKHILNGRITDINLVPLERILKIDIKARNELGEIEELAIIAEVMGKHSNIILIDKKDRTILGAVKHITSRVNRHRVVIPGEIYMPPPAADKRNPEITKELFITLLEKSEENKIEKTLVNNFKGTSLLLAKEVIRRSNISPETKPLEILPGDMERLYIKWNEVWKEFKEEKKAVLYFSSEEKPPWETPFAYPGYLFIFQNFPKKTYGTLNEALDRGYTLLSEEEKIKSEKRNLSASIREKVKKDKQIRKKLEKELKKSEKKDLYRKKGEILIANAHIKIPDNALFIELTDFYTEKEENIKIEIDPTLTMAGNSQNYFKKYKKAEKSKEKNEKELENIIKELDYLENISLSLDMANNLKDLEEIREELYEYGIIKKAKKRTAGKEGPSFLTFRSPDGWEILVGKNNKQNDLLTMKMARGKDIWLHVKGGAGSHVIIRNRENLEMNKIPYRTILTGAKIAAYYSKSRNSSNVLVDYTQKKYVKKPKGSKPGMVIYHGEKSLYVEPEIPPKTA